MHGHSEALLATPLWRRLPRGSSSLPRKVVRRTQRERLIRGAALAVAQRGYAGTAVSHILAESGVSRAAFYQLFDDKEDCFLHGFELVSREHLRAVEAAVAGGASLPVQMIAAIDAYLRFLEVDLEQARAFVVEAEAGSPAIRAAFARAGDRLENVIRGWFERVRAGHPEIPRGSDLTFLTLREGITGTVIHLLEGGKPQLTDGAAPLATFLFATLGLYGWARESEGGRQPSGSPR